MANQDEIFQLSIESVYERNEKKDYLTYLVHKNNVTKQNRILRDNLTVSQKVTYDAMVAMITQITG